MADLAAQISINGRWENLQRISVGLERKRDMEEVSKGIKVKSMKSNIKNKDKWIKSHSN